MAVQEQRFWRFDVTHSVIEDAQIVLGAMRYATAEEALDVFVRFVASVPASRNRVEQVILDDLVGRIALGIAERYFRNTRLPHLAPQRICEQLRHLQEAATLGGTTHWRVRQFFLCVRARYSEAGLTAREVARELRISAWHLARLLREHTGRSFREHLRRLRIDAAKELLLTSALSIKEIAGTVGYGSASAFDHDFNKACGQSPSAFRRMAGANDLWWPTAPRQASDRDKRLMRSR